MDAKSPSFCEQYNGILINARPNILNLLVMSSVINCSAWFSTSEIVFLDIKYKL